MTAGCLQPPGAAPENYTHFIECGALKWAVLEREIDSDQHCIHHHKEEENRHS